MGLSRQDQMANVRRVKGSAEYAYQGGHMESISSNFQTAPGAIGGARRSWDD